MAGRHQRLDAFPQRAPAACRQLVVAAILGMKMSGPKLTERIDMWVEKFDPAGIREPHPTREARYVEIGPTDRDR